jgi:hypothetical protein
VNNFFVGVGNGSASQNATLSADFSGKQVIRGMVGGAVSQAQLGTKQGTPLSVVPATGTSRTRLGASTASSPSGFLKGDVYEQLAFAPLSNYQAGAVLNYLSKLAV